MLIIKILFWISTILLIYNYLLYPIILLIVKFHHVVNSFSCELNVKTLLMLLQNCLKLIRKFLKQIHCSFKIKLLSLQQNKSISCSSTML